LGKKSTIFIATGLGVRPLLARNIGPFDADNGGHSVIVLNYRFWQRHFGGDPHIIGQHSKSITLPTPSSGSCRTASHSITPPAPAMSTCRPPTLRSSPSCAPVCERASRALSLASRARAHHRALPARNRPHPDASSSRRCALANHRLRQLLNPSAGLWQHPPA